MAKKWILGIISSLAALAYIGIIDNFHRSNWLFTICLVILFFNTILFATQLFSYISENQKLKDIQLGFGDISSFFLSKKSLQPEELESSLFNFKILVEHINDHNFDNYLPPSIDKGNPDNLYNVLIKEKIKISELNKQENERKWTNELLNNFGQLLRLHHDHLQNLCDAILPELVKNLNLTLGVIYLKTESETLRLTSCYAYNRKKHINNDILFGEGLIGQSFLEKDMIYLTDIPENYIKITSGLGESLPQCVLIFPLLIDDKAIGVIELASFSHIEPYKIGFCRKLGENIASTISNVQLNTQTKLLLNDSQIKQTKLLAQEEELRQNLEELITTQESLEIKTMEQLRTIEMMKNKEEELHLYTKELKFVKEELEVQFKETRLLKSEMEAREKVLNITTVVSESDIYGNILYINDKFCEVSGFSHEELIGKPHSTVRHPDMPKQLFHELWTTIKSGKIFRGVIKNRKKDGSHYWVDATISPVLDEKGKPIKYIGIRYVIENDELAQHLFDLKFKEFHNLI